MQFSERWLRTLTDPPLDTAGLCDQLTMAGLEVEEAVPAAPPFTGVVVGRIDHVAPHPGADRLRVCTVDAGGPSPLKIVCGAPNAATGMKAPLAHVGALLPGGVAIRKTAVRGVESDGMLCSAKELGISDDAAGLLVLDPGLPVGADLRSALALDDARITLKVTPNRADCLSLVGLARDVAAATGSALALPAIPETPVTGTRSREVHVEDPAACPRFVSRTIEGINPAAPTPAWMKERLERSGLRSISAVVDITNYVMLEQGQPLHAYDDRFLEGAIVVRFARAGEKLTLLNGQVLDLEPDLLLVCDEKKPLGLAGIMGGEHSGISDATTNVLLEGAFWSPAVIQGRSRRLGFVSDAGFRFERGVDFGNSARAVERATQLVLEICGGRAGPLGDVMGALPARNPVRVRPRRVERLLGIDVPDRTIGTLLGRLGLACTRDGGDFIVTPPTYRFDLAIEEDFVEEIARLIGYDAIPAKPAAHLQAMLPDPESTVSAISLKRRLVARDWQEVVTFSFVSSVAEAVLFPDRDTSAAPIAVSNPIASHLDVMRTTLAGGLLDVLRTNLARQHDRVRIFEVGRCFLRKAAAATTNRCASGGLPTARLSTSSGAWPSGRSTSSTSRRTSRPWSLHGRCRRCPAPTPSSTPAVRRGSVLDGMTIGWLGELHPRLAKHFELPRAPVAFELEFAPLSGQAMPVARPVSRMPVVRRDFAVVVDDSVAAGEILDALVAAKPPWVVAVRPFDLYRGPGLASGKKSLAILVLMQDTERTLTDADIDAAVTGLLRVLENRFDATLRQQDLR